MANDTEQPVAAADSEADGYYGDETLEDGELDLSFLDEDEQDDAADHGANHGAAGEQS